MVNKRVSRCKVCEVQQCERRILFMSQSWFNLINAAVSVGLPVSFVTADRSSALLKLVSE